MQLDPAIDAELQLAMKAAGLRFQRNDRGMVKIFGGQLDEQAKAGMLYIAPLDEIPAGPLSFVVPGARWVYCVFYLGGRGLIIEVNLRALTGVGGDHL